MEVLLDEGITIAKPKSRRLAGGCILRMHVIQDSGLIWIWERIDNHKACTGQVCQNRFLRMTARRKIEYHILTCLIACQEAGAAGGSWLHVTGVLIYRGAEVA